MTEKITAVVKRFPVIGNGQMFGCITTGSGRRHSGVVVGVDLSSQKSLQNLAKIVFMPQIKSIRAHLVTLRLTAAELGRLNEQWKSTACRKRSEYLRKKLFSQSIVTLVRDQSLDDVMTEYIRLRKDFNGVTNNFNQLVRKLHSATGAAEFKLWAARADAREQDVLAAIARMEIIIKNVMVKWLQ